jgi:predicted nucleotidyltransferase
MHGMKKIEAVSKLQDHAEAIKAMGATALYLFGSTVRDETEESSDLDLFIDYDPSSRFNAFDLVGIKQFLEDELAIPVDVTTRDGLHPMLRRDIEQTAVRVF